MVDRHSSKVCGGGYICKVEQYLCFPLLYSLPPTSPIFSGFVWAILDSMGDDSMVVWLP
jgi:hypothetical protein